MRKYNKIKNITTHTNMTLNCEKCDFQHMRQELYKRFLPTYLIHSNIRLTY